MALVREMRVGGADGAICRIWDDMATPTPKETAEAMRGEVVYRMLLSQIERGIEPTFQHLEVPTDIEILYDRGVAHEYEVLLSEKPEVREGAAGGQEHAHAAAGDRVLSAGQPVCTDHAAGKNRGERQAVQKEDPRD